MGPVRSRLVYLLGCSLVGLSGCGAEVSPEAEAPEDAQQDVGLPEDTAWVDEGVADTGTDLEDVGRDSDVASDVPVDPEDTPEFDVVDAEGDPPDEVEDAPDLSDGDTEPIDVDRGDSGDSPNAVAFEFRRVSVPVLAEHANMAATTFALADIDGDGDTDVIGGAQIDLASCALINVSTPGEIAFERHAGWCDSGGPHARITRFVGYDFDGDGRDEVAGVAEAGVALVIGLDDGELTYEYIGAFATTQCMPVPYDTDLDGDADLLIYCVDEDNRHFQRDDGTWAEVEIAPTDPWRIRSNTLGVGRLDVDRDGLPDLIRANDTFSVEWARNLLAPPGGVLQRCQPDEDCFFVERRFADGVEAWGSYMGVGNVEIEGLGEVLYLTDAGYNRAVRFGHDWRAVDHAGLGEFSQGRTTDAVGAPTEFLRFSWGVVVDDFDADGRDDLFVTNGGIVDGPFQESQAPDQHEDAVLVQLADGTFTDVGLEVGVTPRGPLDSIVEDDAYLARGALRADFDLDGYLDIVEAAKQGETRMYSVVQARAPSRCTLVPRSSVVTGAGFGYEVFTEPRGWRRWDIDGQYWIAAAPDSLVVPEREGILRFPSGYEVPFDCGDSAGPHEVEEPEWINLVFDEQVSVEFTGVEPESVEVSVDSGPPTPIFPSADGSYRYAGSLPRSAFLLRVDGRWIARNWLL